MVVVGALALAGAMVPVVGFRLVVPDAGQEHPVIVQPELVLQIQAGLFLGDGAPEQVVTAQRGEVAVDRVEQVDGIAEGVVVALQSLVLQILVVDADQQGVLGTVGEPSADHPVVDGPAVERAVTIGQPAAPSRGPVWYRM